uniref:Uncharacterized protein n=1 Tax=Meloidogyne enterolobii TaxID=390850 RepID=A0A6V7TT47_MELEN|nr:unnamed protein product [Meloidogyne enterolobii]
MQMLGNPRDHETNMFILYNLFTLARRLIQMFISGHAYYYLDQFTQINLQIPLLTYIEAYDEFEVRANFLYQALGQLHIFTFMRNYMTFIHGQYFSKCQQII